MCVIICNVFLGVLWFFHYFCSVRTTNEQIVEPLKRKENEKSIIHGADGPVLFLDSERTEDRNSSKRSEGI